MVLLASLLLFTSPPPHPTSACHGTGRLSSTDVSVGHNGAGPNTKVCGEAETNVYICEIEILS